ncbi:MAG TPA: hypothetical protein VEV15_01890 [Flavisolibacter sp.]|nr:hypothetical protein [Flavisolibacter sp.]
MKTTIIFLCACLSLLSCAKKYALEDPIPADDVNIIVQETEVPNVYRFINSQIGKTAKADWDLGNGQNASGDTVIGKYPFKGNYTVSLTIFNGLKPVKKSTLLSLRNDNVNLDSVYVFLTGGADSVAGKTWVLDSLSDAHIKLINSGSTTPVNKLGKAGKGVYDDELIFKLNNREVIYNNHGTSYCHGGTIDGITQFRFKELGALWGTATNPVADGGDLMINYTPAQPVQRWTMSIRNGKHYLQLYDGAFFFFYRGGASGIEYEITSISKNEMVVTHYETEPTSRANALWRDVYLLIRKGYVR